MNQASRPRSHEFAGLVRSAHQEMSTAQKLAGWHALRRRTLGHERRLRLRRLAAAASLLVALTLAAGIAIGRSLASSPLKYSISAGEVGEGGQLRVDAAGGVLHFSDGSEVRLGAALHGRLVSVTHDGARLRLSDGEAEVSVVSRPNANWELAAGPYSVAVRGAHFEVAWREREQTLRLSLRSGTVSVEGPLATDGITLYAGQVLTIRKPEGEIVVRDIGAPERPLRARAPRSELSWSELLTEGRFSAVVAQAEARGLEDVLSRASSADLAALADAARFSKNSAVAESALRAERARFPESAGAYDAAFLLGQLYEAKSPASSEAESWYETYLSEAPAGAYAAEALGHKMLVVERRARRAAIPIAREYLERFPDGAYERNAQAILALSQP